MFHLHAGEYSTCMLGVLGGQRELQMLAIEPVSSKGLLTTEPYLPVNSVVGLETWLSY